MKVSLLSAGHCSCSELLSLKGGSKGTVHFPAAFALLEHESHGFMLFDTGYAAHFLKATQKLPERLYRWTTPVTLNQGQSAVEQLTTAGIAPEQISRIFISHFHGDHIAGLRDFPSARFTFLPEAYAPLQGLTGFKALRHAFLPELLPTDFEQRSEPITEDRICALPEPFNLLGPGYDLCGDGSLFGVSLPGHSDGQLGLLVPIQGQPLLLVADAAWSLRAIRENRLPSSLTCLVFADHKAYAETLYKLHQLQKACPEAIIFPAHCREAHRLWGAR